MQSWKKPTEELIERALSSIKREKERIRFFSRLNNPHWVAELVKREYFSDPPKIKYLDGGALQFPLWHELTYLSRVARHIPAEAINIAERIPKTDNPQIGYEYIQMALTIDCQHSVRLKDKLIEYINNPFHISVLEISKVLAFWVNAGKDGMEASLDLLRAIAPFNPDPKQGEKIANRASGNEIAQIFSSRLEPVPKFDAWEYQEIMLKGVRPVADVRPLEVCKILIEALDQMIRLSKHWDDLEKTEANGYDGSEFWCQRVDAPVSYSSAKEVLVHTLTYACMTVFEKDAVNIDRLMDTLQPKKWNIFRRIQYSLCARFPEPMKDPIAGFITATTKYSDGDYGLEFADMVSVACPKFGKELLADDQWTKIFEAILSGPDKPRIKEFWGDKFTEENFLKRKMVFHKMQFWPFKAVLFGEYKEVYDEACRQFPEPVSLDDYAPFSTGNGAKVVESIAPTPIESLSSKNDEDLIKYLNEWDNPGRKPDEWWVEIDHNGLGKQFADLIKNAPSRFARWSEKWNQILRPIYLRYALDVASDFVKTGSLDQMESWLALCSHVVSQNDAPKTDDTTASETSAEKPHWTSARSAAADFLRAIFAKETNLPIKYKDDVGSLLKALCTQYDSRLDKGWTLLVDKKEPISTAINTVRGRALQALFAYANWLGRNDQSDDLSKAILEGRFAEKPALTEPEYALLGMHFYDLMRIDLNWATELVPRLFSKTDNSEYWRTALTSYLVFNNAHSGAFDALKATLVQTLENVSLLQKQEGEQKEALESLGGHLVSYYLWEKYELTGDASLIAKYYQKVDPRYYAAPAHYIGVGIKDQTNFPDQNPQLKERIKKFFEWRLSTAEERFKDPPERADDYSKELLEFYWWFQCRGLEIGWKFEKLLKVLELVKTPGHISMLLEELSKHLHDHRKEVLQCFAAITSKTQPDEYFFISDEHAKPILLEGLNSEDAELKKLADEARENLLKAGSFEYLDVGK